jgi:hypothetical protein
VTEKRREGDTMMDNGTLAGRLLMIAWERRGTRPLERTRLTSWFPALAAAASFL